MRNKFESSKFAIRHVRESTAWDEKPEEARRLKADGSKPELKLRRLIRPTSVENLAFQLLPEITDMGVRLTRLELQETDPSVVVYTHEDWVAESRLLGTVEQTCVSAPTRPGP